MPQPRTRFTTLLATAAALLFLGAGCPDAPVPPPPPPPPEAQFDVTTTTCPEIASARAKVAAAYEASVRAASDRYVEARTAFQADLEQCLGGIWKGGPCDKEYAATQTAYQNAWGDISNDQFYKEWKKAKADWDACYGNYEQKSKDWVEANKGKEKLCQEEFQAKVAAAETAYQNAVSAAKAKRDADTAFLDELEKKCREPKPAGGGTTTGVIPGGTATGGTTTGGTAGGGTTTGGTTYQPNSRACQDAVPGENGTVRQGRASDFGPRDILINLMTTVAEDVTKTPLPTSAINDQIFAGIVCVKIRTRLAEMEYEWIDAIGDNRRQRRIEQMQARYNRALSVWCAIAEGKPALPEVKKDVAALNAMPSGACTKDADCGPPVCCSAQEVGTPRCDTATGACRNEKTQCVNPQVCGGSPAQCVTPRQKIKAINVNGKFIPLSQVHAFKGDECDDEEHWHANAGGSARATDGTTVTETSRDCGYGKVNDVPVVDVDAGDDKEYRVEIRGLEGLRR